MKLLYLGIQGYFRRLFISQRLGNAPEKVRRRFAFVFVNNLFSIVVILEVMHNLFLLLFLLVPTFGATFPVALPLRLTF